MLMGNRALADSRFDETPKFPSHDEAAEITMTAAEALSRKAAAEKRMKILVGVAGIAGIVVGAIAAFVAFRE